LTVQQATADQRTVPDTPPSSGTGWRLSPGPRKWLVAAHTLVGVGWFGIVLAKLVLEIVAGSTGDLSLARAGFVFASALDRELFPQAAVMTLVTGVVLSLATPWGLFKYWWIVVKLALTVAVIATGVAFVGAWAEKGIVAAADGDVAAVSIRLIGAAVVHLLMLGAATVISVLKPWGQIRPVREVGGRVARRSTRPAGI
jgi:hypothetical protein